MKKGIVYIVFGVSGSGKTTIGQALAEDLGVPFYDADDFHPEVNIKKMSDGTPLGDTDREPWLQKLAEEISDWHHRNGAVLACSALKQKYRETLGSIDPKFIKWIFLDGSYELIANRLEFRNEHFFTKELLLSQFETLEKPENALRIDIDKSEAEIISEIKSKLDIRKSQLGLIGLGVMGKSLAKNVLSRNHSLSVYNRQVPGKEIDIAKKFVQEQPDSTTVQGFDNVESFVASLEQPRTILIMVNAGRPVDRVIEAMVPYLNKGDCLIDGGNSHYKDSLRRENNLGEIGISFLGAGISGGEEGALKGPSIMPGGSKEAYEQSGKFLESIAARDKEGNPCCTYIGPEGSGHYVKMVHNGIEYAEMQLISEVYHLLRFFGKKTPEQIAEVLESWKNDGLDSYILEITIHILAKKEGKDYLIDKILDKAGQKGTGGWSTIASLEAGMPLSTISESVMARNLSGMKSQRIKASEVYQMKPSIFQENEARLIEKLKKAYMVVRIINHHIGFELIKQASQDFDWELNLSEIARVWTNGCIIRSSFMEKTSELLSTANEASLLLFSEIVEITKSNISSLTEIVATGIKAGYALPVLSSAANYFLLYTSAQSSANMIQAQRDYFGAHTYERVDKPLGAYFHTNWKS